MASAQNLDDFSDPLFVIFNTIKPGVTPEEVNALLTSAAYRAHGWGIHERDIRERTDRWDVSLRHYRENVFANNDRGGSEYIGSDLFIYFVGTRTGCLFYRFWGEGVRTALQRGDLCHLFAGY